MQKRGGRKKPKGKRHKEAEVPIRQQEDTLPVRDRKYRARPGKFMGIQMRSQLEIRFAAELEDRKIKWVYEPEVLGEGGHLVDFFLPTLKIWVEVKGRFEPRDHYLLNEVAEYLQQERHQHLFVYTAGKCFAVNGDGLQEMERKDFWNTIQMF